MGVSLRLAVMLLVLVFVVRHLRLAVGRMAPQFALAPLLFLVTRKWVLGVGLAGTVGWMALLLPNVIQLGDTPLGTLATLFGISVLCGFGVAALTVGPGFVIARALTPPPHLPLSPGETVVHDESANHWLGGEARGGRLIVTDRRLGFRPHRFNVQCASWSTALEDLRAARAEGERLVIVEVAGASEPVWFVTSDARRLAAKLTELSPGALSGPS